MLSTTPDAVCFAALVKRDPRPVRCPWLCTIVAPRPRLAWCGCRGGCALFSALRAASRSHCTVLYTGTCVRPFSQPIVDVPGLTKIECKTIVVQQLKEYRKRLTHEQLELLLSKAESTKPLYLLTCCEELRCGLAPLAVSTRGSVVLPPFCTVVFERVGARMVSLCVWMVVGCVLHSLQAQYGSFGSGVDGMIRELPGDVQNLMDVVLERVER